jgi:hypothetical protein
MNQLPQPGPGRPQHPSYSEPGPQMSGLELVLWVVGISLVVFCGGGVWTFVEGLAGA